MLDQTLTADLRERSTALQERLGDAQRTLAAVTERIDHLESRATEGHDEKVRAALYARQHLLMTANVALEAEITAATSRLALLEDEHLLAQATERRTSLSHLLTDPAGNGEGAVTAFPELQQARKQAEALLASYEVPDADDQYLAAAYREIHDRQKPHAIFFGSGNFLGFGGVAGMILEMWPLGFSPATPSTSPDILNMLNLLAGTSVIGFCSALFALFTYAALRRRILGRAGISEAFVRQAQRRQAARKMRDVRDAILALEPSPDVLRSLPTTGEGEEDTLAQRFNALATERYVDRRLADSAGFLRQR